MGGVNIPLKAGQIVQGCHGHGSLLPHPETNKVAKELLTYYVDIGSKECFTGLLYICFNLVWSDVIELSWQHTLNDFYMPYKIQSMPRNMICVYSLFPHSFLLECAIICK